MGNHHEHQQSGVKENGVCSEHYRSLQLLEAQTETKGEWQEVREAQRVNFQRPRGYPGKDLRFKPTISYCYYKVYHKLNGLNNIDLLLSYSSRG